MDEQNINPEIVKIAHAAAVGNDTAADADARGDEDDDDVDDEEEDDEEDEDDEEEGGGESRCVVESLVLADSTQAKDGKRSVQGSSKVVLPS